MEQKLQKRFSREDDPPGNDFLGQRYADNGRKPQIFLRALGMRTVKIRTAVVLEKTDSALARLMKPARFGFLVQTGSGDQYMPWIHIDDLVQYLSESDEGSNNDGSLSMQQLLNMSITGIL